MNELKDASSPYLRQHADNPVHWRQWTPQTLAAAKASGKPILLSVGYAACHWCHVMAHESFEDETTAAVMNELFVNIKVDREERPDVDHIYMSALHAFGQRGGWPLTMFLTPDAEPFWGGTYFPKQARYGQPAFVSVLTSVERAFRAEPERIAKNTRAILDHLDTSHDAAAPAVTLKEMDALAAQLAGHMDAVNGGMQGAPKFPNPQILEFLWRAADRSNVPHCRARVLKSLERMCQGGIYDHLGGGFARYSVDDRWLVPHFEKMLYDNAQLIELLALAAAHSETPPDLATLFRARLDETIGWLKREMRAPGGMFYASLDADSEGQEGKFYVWQADEIEAVLGPEDASVFCDAYDVTPGGNFEDPHGGPTANILNRLSHSIGDAAHEARLATMRAKLLDHRSRRVRPGLDDKVLVDWNGLVATALVRAGALLDRPDWIELGARAHVETGDSMTLGDGTRPRLTHSRRGAVAMRAAFALDYAAMARTAVILAESDDAAELDRRDRIREAETLLATLLDLHRDPTSGLLAISATDAGDVILRLKPTQDDAIPNPHPIAIEALIRLAALTGEQRWLDEADALLTALSGAVQANFVAHVGVMNALDLRLRGASIVIAGTQREVLRKVVLQTSWLARIVLDLDDIETLPPDHPGRAQAASAGVAAAFVCRSGTCSLPVHDAAALRALLAQGDTAVSA